MTNKEILQASLLDILFDNRNKDYGAYALRNGYNHRLIAALISTLSVATIIFLFISFHREEFVIPNETPEGMIVKITEATLPIIKPKETVRQLPKPVDRFAQAKFTTKIEIVKDILLKETDVPENKELQLKEISTITTSGVPFDGTQQINKTINSTSGNGGNESNNESTITLVERNPEFPGGDDALRLFLKNNLNTPDDLEAGEKKTVQVKFKVGTDGIVSNIEVILSGGNSFDREVVRVCKKMPRWKPAFQNGINVAISYIIPVTFMGVEQ